MSHVTAEQTGLVINTININRLPLAELHGERLPHFSETPFAHLFEQQVDQRPDAIALVCKDERLTFGELNARANQLARHLQKLGVAHESIVGICIDRSVEMAIAIIATLKAGAAYLPLDPEYPQERLAFMVEDAQPALVLSKAGLVERLSGSQTRLVLLDEDSAEISANSTENLAVAPAKNALAYVIYTSGSTGQPKGVMITQGGLANYLQALNQELKIDANDLYLHTA